MYKFEEAVGGTDPKCAVDGQAVHTIVQQASASEGPLASMPSMHFVSLRHLITLRTRSTQHTAHIHSIH